VVVARLETAGVICMETFNDFPRMARFILRDEGVCGRVHTQVHVLYASVISANMTRSACILHFSTNLILW